MVSVAINKKFQQRYTINWSWFWVASFIICGLLIRLSLINVYFMDTDEVWHVDLADKSSLREVIGNNFTENVHPPLYYLLLHVVMGINDAIAALRMLSILPWALWVCVCYAIGNELKGKTLGLIWAALASFSSGALEMSFAIREYMWMELFLTMQFLYFIRMCKLVSHRDLWMYSLCGLIAISFEYSSVISIFTMGSVLAFQHLKRNFQSLKIMLAMGLAHFLLAAFFLVMYSHHEFYRIEHIKWYNAYNYAPTMRALFVSLEQVINFVVRPDMAICQLLVLSLFVTLHNFGRKFPALTALLVFNWIVMLALNYGQFYPPATANRFMTWMLPSIMAWLAFSILSFYEYLPFKIRHYTIIAVLAGVIWKSAASFTIAANTTEEHQSFLQVADTIPKADFILMDIQTAMALKYHSDWHFVTHYEHLDEALWKERKVLYPNWRKMDSIDTQTGKVAGGVALDHQTLLFFDQVLQQQQGPKSSYVWLVQMGFRPNLSKECIESLGRLGTMKINTAHGLILRFETQKFYNFADGCPIKQNPFR